MSVIHCCDAIRRNYTDTWKELVRDMSTNDINSLDDNGQTPLLCAAINNVPEAVVLILKRQDIDLNVVTGVETTPYMRWNTIMCVLVWANMACLKLLLDDERLDLVDTNGRHLEEWMEYEPDDLLELDEDTKRERLSLITSVRNIRAQKVSKEMETAAAMKEYVKMAAEYGVLLDTKRLADFTIVAAGKPIQCHQAVLASRCPFFNAMLGSGMVDAVNREIVVDNFSTETMQSVLKFVYTGTVGDVSEGDVTDILAAADFFLLEGLVNMLGERMRVNLSLDNVWATLVFADRYRMMDLRNAALEFIVQRGQGFMEQEDENRQRIVSHGDIFIDIMMAMAKQMAK